MKRSWNGPNWWRNDQFLKNLEVQSGFLDISSKFKQVQENQENQEVQEMNQEVQEMRQENQETQELLVLG